MYGRARGTNYTKYVWTSVNMVLGARVVRALDCMNYINRVWMRARGGHGARVVRAHAWRKFSDGVWVCVYRATVNVL